MQDTVALSERIKNFAALSTQSDRELLSLLRTTTDPATVILPDGTGAQRLKEVLYVAAGGYKSALDLIARVKPVIGRACLLVRNNPQIAIDLGYRNFDHWMTEGVPANFCISRAEAFNCLSIAEHLPDLPAPEMQTLGIGKLYETSQAIKRDTCDGESKEVVARKREFWLAEAKKAKTVNDLKRVVEEHKIVDVGARQPREWMSLFVNPETKKRWGEFKADPDVREYVFENRPVETSYDTDDEELLERVLADTWPHWKAQAEDARRARMTGQVQAG